MLYLSTSTSGGLVLRLTLPAAGGWAASRLEDGPCGVRLKQLQSRFVLPLPVQKVFGGAVLSFRCVCVCMRACRHASV